jgi:hypothetical protein
MKTTVFQYKGSGVTPQFSTYQNNNRLALILIDTEWGNCYSTPTVNLVDEKLTNENCAYLDTNNCGEYILNWLEQHDFGKPTGCFGFSGFCMYPEFEFRKEIIEEYKVEPTELEEE